MWLLLYVKRRSTVEMMNPLPSQAELEALEMLTTLGKATVRDLHERICRSGHVGYTTVQKRLQRMEEKGLVKRVSNEGRKIVYAPIARPEAARQSVVERLVKSVFDNSPNALIQQALGQAQLTREEIAEIRARLDEIERDTS